MSNAKTKAKKAEAMKQDRGANVIAFDFARRISPPQSVETIPPSPPTLEPNEVFGPEQPSPRCTPR